MKEEFKFLAFYAVLVGICTLLSTAAIAISDLISQAYWVHP